MKFRKLYLTPVFIGIILNIIDFFSSWYVINYLDLGIGEANPLSQNSDKTFNYQKALFLDLIEIVIVNATYILMYMNTAKALSVEKKLADIIIKYNNWGVPLAFIFGYIWTYIFLVFGWNFLITLVFQISLDIGYYELIFVAACLGSIMGIFWTLSYFLRYIESDMQKKHRLLLLPYKMGFMKISAT